MPLYLKLKSRCPAFNIELVTLDNLNCYEEVFYSNQEYFLMTDGHPATKRDCIETIEYGNGFPDAMCYCIGFSLNDEAVALLSIFEGYPETDTLYIGLFLMNEKFKRKSIGSKMISSLIDEAFNAQFNSIKLSVQDNNIGGFAFWDKLGFQIIKKCACDNFYNLSMELKKGV